MKKSIASKILTFVDKNAPTILTTFGVIGVGLTAVAAVRATPQAETLIFDEEDKKGEPLTKIETVKVAWKPYIPVAMIAGATIGCIVGAQSINSKRNAAISAAYVVAEAALSEYRDEVKKHISSQKADEIDTAIAQKHVDEHPSKDAQIIVTGNGETKCYDMYSGRYFLSSIEELRQLENRFNRRLVEGMEFLTVNDLYEEMNFKDLPPIRSGEELGFDVASGLLEFRFSAVLDDSGNPCIAVDFGIPSPRYKYSIYER